MALSTKAEILDICPSPYGYAVFVQASKKIFVMYVDRARGMAMQAAMSGCKSSRPLTHEFVAQMLDGLECTVKGVLIYHVCEGTFYTRLMIEMKNELGSKIVDVDGRPSDTISIALRTGAPIYVSEDVLSKVADMSEAFKKIKGAR